VRAIGSCRKLIRNRPPTFLAGRAFTAQEIQDIQETIEMCGLPWTELVWTICEHLNWVTPTGRYKEKSCISALRRLEALGWLKLPTRQPARRPEVEIVSGHGSDPEEEIVGTVREMAPLRLEPVYGKQAIRLWNEYVARYHALGYRRPFGAHQRYFVIGRGERRLGCLLFAAALGRWRSGTAGYKKFGEQSFVAGGRTDLRRLARALRVRAGVAGDLRGVGTLPGNLLSRRKLDSCGGNPGRGTDGPSQFLPLGTSRDLPVSVSRGLSIVSTGEER
jgi:hypothetical protein